jgi:4-hydroxy-tetrahydrodipicolinate reductase
MYISIIGYGKMGRLLEETANQRKLSVVSTIDPSGSARYDAITETSVQGADVCICFTEPSSVMETISKLSALQKDIVMATTGWYDRLDDAIGIVASANVGMVWSPNFALGVNLFFQMVEMCASIIDRFDDYDVAVHEVHHRAKIDSPSGTAGSLGNILLKQIHRKRSLNTDKLESALQPDEIQVSSTRCGYVPGQHSVLFDSEVDTIELTHTARSRKGFAVGALSAASWIRGKKGVYTKEDMLADLLSSRNAAVKNSR